MGSVTPLNQFSPVCMSTPETEKNLLGMYFTTLQDIHLHQWFQLITIFM